jgi:type II secretion system (T2SS) protein G
LAGVCVLIVCFIASPLYPYTRVVTIDLYNRSHLMMAILFVTSLGLSWFLAKIVRLKPELIRRTIWIAAVALGIPIIMWISHEPALNPGAQKQAMANIRTIAKAIELFRTRKGSYPEARDIDSLEPILHSEIPKLDSWGTPFYVSSGNDGYIIKSFAADGHPDAKEQTGMTVGFATDIVFKNGSFISYPEGVPR